MVNGCDYFSGYDMEFRMDMIDGPFNMISFSHKFEFILLLDPAGFFSTTHFRLANGFAHERCVPRQN